MGGSGSGRYGWRGVVEQRYRVGVRDILRFSGFVPGRTGSLTWSRDGEPIASVGYVVGADYVELRYCQDSDGSEVRYPITYISTPCRFGGRRRFWLCGSCGNRREAVYMRTSGRTWACRVCLRLQYTSQRLAPGDRMERRAERIYDSLGGEHDDGLIHKPKRMRWSTFSRKMDKADELSGAADSAWLQRVGRMLSRWGQA